MAQTYSTLRRDMARGQVYSSRVDRIAALLAGEQAQTLTRNDARPTVSPNPGQAVGQASPTSPDPESFHFTLSTQGLFPTPYALPTAAGAVSVTGHSGSPYAVTGSMTGVLPLRDPAVHPTLWLIHDLTVPADLAPADLALLPKGVAGTGNAPGSLYTVDGNPPTYGPVTNTLSIAISPGNFQQGTDGTWHLTGTVDEATNQTFHPLVLLGPTYLADMNTGMASGTSARILTDLFMRQGTVYPGLSLQTQFLARLVAILRDVLAGSPAPAFLPPSRFTRAAVTLEGLIRITPKLMPTRETVLLRAFQRV